MMLEKPHKKLEVWQQSILLIQKVYALTNRYPKSEEYGLINQMRRAAVSVPANIAEGAARQTKKEFIHFLHVAQGSLSELDTHIEVSLKLEYIKEDSITGLSPMMNQIDKMLTGLIKSLKKG